MKARIRKKDQDYYRKDQLTEQTRKGERSTNPVLGQRIEEEVRHWGAHSMMETTESMKDRGKLLPRPNHGDSP